MALQWKFPRNEAGEDEGLADAGIETFRDAPFSGLARECGQNSIDAARLDSITGKSERVVVRFIRESVPTEAIPDIVGLRATIAACLRRARDSKDSKEIQFFTRARDVLNQQQVEILHIQDEGTTGLVGPCEPGTPYHALVKAKGVSKKGDDTSGGSFGIGKNAAYAVSALRSVFYTTVYSDGERRDKFLAQGKAILVSHTSDNGQPLSATGYWGNSERYLPHEILNDLPDWLQRTELGTTVSAIGFLSEDNWDWRIAESLIRNFFSAIHNERIVFEVGDDLVISREKLAGFFEHSKILEVAQSRGYEEELTFSHHLYRCLISPEKNEYEEEFAGLGRVKLSILIEEKLEKMVGLVRNGMFITSSFRHFQDRLARFPLQKDFIAVVEPVDNEAAANIRALENPRHDELSPERIEGPAKRAALRGAVNQMNGWIRSKIKEHTTLPPDDEIQLDDLNEFFVAPEDNTEKMQTPGDSETDPTSITITPRSTRSGSGASSTGGDEGGSGGEKPRSGGGTTSGPGAGTGKGGAGGSRGGSVPVEGLRNRIVAGSPRSRVVFFTPKKSGMARFEVIAAGISDDEQIPITSAGGLPVSRGGCEIELREDERVELAVELQEPYDGPIEIALRLMEGNDEAQG